MSGIPKCDFHVHTKYLGCANAIMEIPAIVQTCQRLGVRQLGITDHLNSLDQLTLHQFIKRDIESLAPEIEVYFGVELNFTALDGEFAFSAAIKEQYGFQFAIGGIHGTYVEEYIAYLSIIAEEGACFSLASDAHDIQDLKNVQTVWQVAEQLNLSADRIWRPKCKPMAGS